MCRNPNAKQRTIQEKYDAYKSIKKEYFKTVIKSKISSWEKFTSECEDIYKLNKIIFKKQQNSISMMESCNTGLQSSNILLDTHFPGSTQLGNFPLPTSSQVGMDETSPVSKPAHYQLSCARRRGK